MTREQSGNCLLDFGLSENVPFVGKFSSRNAKLRAEKPTLEESEDKIEILST